MGESGLKRNYNTTTDRNNITRGAVAEDGVQRQKERRNSGKGEQAKGSEKVYLYIGEMPLIP